jgi:hypothetical protein
MLSHPDRSGWIFNNTSTGTYSVGGQRQATCTISGCTARQTETIIHKTGNLPYDPRGSGGGPGFRAFYKWAKDMKTIYVQVRANMPNMGASLEMYGKCPDKPAVTSNSSYAASLEVAIPTEGITQLEIKLDDNYNIKGDKISKTRNVTWGQCQGPGKITTTATWSSASPKSPPKNDTDARIADPAGN